MMPKKILIVSWLCIAAVLFAACAPAATPAPAPVAPTEVPPTQSPDGMSGNNMAMPTGPAMVKVGSNAKLGQILTDDKGRTVYLLTTDTATTTTCTDTCETAWPPLLTSGAAVGAGLDAKIFGTLTRAHGGVQVTFNGHPLYYFAADTQPGDANGQGVSDVWYVVSPQGDAVKK